jgi:hypothetical protein
MEHSVILLSSAMGEGEANSVGDHPNHVDAEAMAETAKKQRRKIQNRKNQRAHRGSFPQCLTPCRAHEL